MRVKMMAVLCAMKEAPQEKFQGTALIWKTGRCPWRWYKWAPKLKCTSIGFMCFIYGVCQCIINLVPCGSKFCRNPILRRGVVLLTFYCGEFQPYKRIVQWMLNYSSIINSLLISSVISAITPSHSPFPIWIMVKHVLVVRSITLFL